MSNVNLTLRFCKKCQSETQRNLDGSCKICKKALSALIYSKNPDRRKTTQAIWRAANPEKVKAIKAAWVASNPARNKANNAAWHAANFEKEKVRSAAWAEKNPESRRISHQNRRARKMANGGVLSKGLATKLFNLQQGKCACCSLPLGATYHLDHIMPIKLGGPNVDSNMQLLRQRCNIQKHASHPVDFMQSRGFLL